jgi:diguanylate cyclase (GGDEF)-like protein
MLEIQIIVVIGIIIVLAGAGYFYFTREIKKREKERKLQELLDSTDELTLVSNTRYIDSMLEKELDRSRRHDRGLSFVVIEIDKFDEIKEEYGQQFSKRILKDTAENLQEKIRAYDILARDKHRFLCLFPETGMESALLLSKRARAVVASESYLFRNDLEPIHVTASIGATSCNPDRDKNLTTETVKATAFEALDVARQNGMNRVEFIAT